MTQFVFFAALFALLAVALAVSALWQRSRMLALGLAVGLPLAAAGVYLLQGHPEALQPVAATAPTPATMEQAVADLEKRVSADPADYEDRITLARFYMAQQHYDKARDIYAEAMKLRPDDSDMSVEYSEALLRAAPDHRFPAEAATMLQAAVAKNPQNQRALFFLGAYDLQESRPAEAVATWEKLLPLLDAPAAAALQKQIDAVRATAGMAPAEPEATAPALLAVDISIDPTLAKAVRPGSTLYVFARVGDGQGPPVAVRRVTIDKLPMHITLSDADGPMPTAKLSAQTQVQVMARLSVSGDARPASGDIEADPRSAKVGQSAAIALVLNRPVP